MREGKNSLFTFLELNGSSFEQIWIPFNQRCFAPNLVEIGQAALKKKFLEFVHVFSLFCNYPPPPLEKGGALHLNKLESLSPEEALCQIGWNWPCCSGERFFDFVNEFLFFGNYHSLEKGGTLHLNKFESP